MAKTKTARAKARKAKTRRPQRQTLHECETMRELHDRATGDDAYKRLCIVACENVAADGLRAPYKRRGMSLWQASFSALMDYVGALVGECGCDEDEAFAGTLDEINHVRDCVSDDVSLEWPA